MTDRYTKLLELIEAPVETSVEDIAQHILEENEAIVDLARYNNVLVSWLSYIYRNSRGKARKWANEALGSEEGPPRT